MTPSNRTILVAAGKIKDLAVLFLALKIAYSIGNTGSAHLFLSRDLRHPIQSFVLTIGLGVAWHSSLSIIGLHRSHRLSTFYKEVLEIAAGTILCSVFAFLWLAFFCTRSGDESVLCFQITSLFAIVAFGLLSVVRGICRLTAQAVRRRGHNLRHVIIVGSNRRGTSFAESLKIRPGWGYHLHGFIDDIWYDDERSSEYCDKLLGDLDHLPHCLRTMAVDEVVVSLPIASFYNQIAEIIQTCKEHGILVRYTGKLFDTGHSRRGLLSKSSLDMSLLSKATSHRSLLSQDSSETITLHDESWDAWAYLIKRIVDISVASILLLLCAPVMGIVALLIKLDSPGPIFFLQTRLGLGKRPFKIYKFRTMFVDAEKRIDQVAHLNETQGPTFKLKNDPRITKIGTLLRKTSLDEIPQLINVVRGEMSLVGPRPLPLRDYEGFSEDWHRRRFSVKPGITCIWQIMGRSSITFEQWMELDMHYIDHWSVWLDIKILAQTIPAVLRGSGAV